MCIAPCSFGLCQIERNKLKLGQRVVCRFNGVIKQCVVMELPDGRKSTDSATGGTLRKQVVAEWPEPSKWIDQGTIIAVSCADMACGAGAAVMYTPPHQYHKGDPHVKRHYDEIVKLQGMQPQELS